MTGRRGKRLPGSAARSGQPFPNFPHRFLLQTPHHSQGTQELHLQHGHGNRQAFFFIVVDLIFFLAYTRGNHHLPQRHEISRVENEFMECKFSHLRKLHQEISVQQNKNITALLSSISPMS